MNFTELPNELLMKIFTSLPFQVRGYIVLIKIVNSSLVAITCKNVYILIFALV